MFLLKVTRNGGRGSPPIGCCSGSCYLPHVDDDDDDDDDDEA
jgi:hypothetical protein